MIDIQFEKELYYSGETITGNVSINLKKAISLRSYKITFHGSTIIPHKETFTVENAKLHPYKHQEVHVEKSYYLWKSEDGTNKLPAGYYNWDFSFDLPVNCPSSFEGEKGFIRYTVQVLIDKPWWPDYLREKPISVCHPTDLNLLPMWKDPVSFQKETKNVIITISTPNYGCVSGQNIMVSGQIQNQSPQHITALEGVFRRVVTTKRTYSDSDNNQKKDFKVYWEDFHVAPWKMKDYCFTLEVPPLVATIRNSVCLKVEYFIRVKAVMKHKEVKVDLGVLVGNVPLAGEAGEETPEAQQTLMKGEKAELMASHFKFGPLFPYFGDGIRKIGVLDSTF